MSTWLPAALPAAVALVLLLAPGWVVARVAGARGLVAAGAAPGLSVGVLGVSAVAGGVVGLPWSLPVVVAGTAAATGAALLLGRWVRGESAADARRRAAALAAAIGPRHRAGAAHAARAISLPETASAPSSRRTVAVADVAQALPLGGRTGGATSVALLERPRPGDGALAPPGVGVGGPTAGWVPGGAAPPPVSRRAAREAQRSSAARPAASGGTPPWVVGAAAVAGLVVAAALTLPRMLEAIGTPRAVSQSFDAVFHLNAVRHVLVTGDASSLTLGTLTSPERGLAFYPAAWHGLVALVAGTTGVGVDVATNATAVVVAALLWPLPVVALVRALAGPRPVAVALGAALPAAVVAAPQVQLEWGVLYPLVLSSLALPGALALLVTATRRGPAPGLVGAVDPASTPRRRFAHLVLAAAVVPGMVLAQTSTVFALALLALPLGVGTLAGWAARRSGTGRTGWLVALAGVLATLGVVAAGWAWVDSTAAVESLRTTDWEAQSTWQQAVRHAVLLGYFGRPAALFPAVLVLAGLGVALARRGWRWLAVAHALASTVYVFARAVDSDLSQVLTGFWYNDAYRTPVLPVVTGLALAALAGWQLLSLAARAVPASAGLLRRVPALHLVGCALALAAVAAGARGTSVDRGYAELAENHVVGDDESTADLLTASERALVDRVPQHVPEGVAVAGNPWNGSALVSALADRPTPFPHLQHQFDARRELVAEHLRDAVGDPQVCSAVRSLDVGFVLDLGPGHLWGGDREGGDRDLRYPGLERLDEPDAASGFELVDVEGDAKLYRVTACG